MEFRSKKQKNRVSLEFGSKCGFTTSRLEADSQAFARRPFSCSHVIILFYENYNTIAKVAVVFSR